MLPQVRKPSWPQHLLRADSDHARTGWHERGLRFATIKRWTLVGSTLSNSWLFACLSLLVEPSAFFTSTGAWPSLFLPKASLPGYSVLLAPCQLTRLGCCGPVQTAKFAMPCQHDIPTRRRASHVVGAGGDQVAGPSTFNQLVALMFRSSMRPTVAVDTERSYPQRLLAC